MIFLMPICGYYNSCFHWGNGRFSLGKHAFLRTGAGYFHWEK
jgi:hypothetical protein